MAPELTPEEDRELAIDTIASWALDGMEPTPAMLEDINALINRTMTTGEIIAKASASGYVDGWIQPC